jgi:hypothetical protein
VRIELPFSERHAPAERNEKAARRFREWLEAGVLIADDAPCIYVYRQDYVAEAALAEGPRRGRVAGVIGALRLGPFGDDSGVLPHEHTMPGPIEDRLALLRACPVNISPSTASTGAGASWPPTSTPSAGREDWSRLHAGHERNRTGVIRDSRPRTVRLTVGALWIAVHPASGGTQNGISWRPSVSADGRYVAFY